MGWLDPLGSVVAILETIQLVYVYVRPKGSSVTTPVLFNPAQVTDRVYFDDYPPRGATVT